MFESFFELIATKARLNGDEVTELIVRRARMSMSGLEKMNLFSDVPKQNDKGNCALGLTKDVESALDYFIEEFITDDQLKRRK